MVWTDRRHFQTWIFLNSFDAVGNFLLSDLSCTFENKEELLDVMFTGDGPAYCMGRLWLIPRKKFWNGNSSKQICMNEKCIETFLSNFQILWLRCLYSRVLLNGRGRLRMSGFSNAHVHDVQISQNLALSLRLWNASNVPKDLSSLIPLYSTQIWKEG